MAAGWSADEEAATAAALGNDPPPALLQPSGWAKPDSPPSHVAGAQMSFASQLQHQHQHQHQQETEACGGAQRRQHPSPSTPCPCLRCTTSCLPHAPWGGPALALLLWAAACQACPEHCPAAPPQAATPP
jgi:hypothetical protein